MLKAFRYLKPFWLSVIAVIAFVFGQVQCELALPDYMSDIVTYGIQYNGITANIPQAIRTDTMEHMAYFLSDSDYQTILQSYRLDNTVTLEGKEYSTNEEVYVLKDGADASVQNIISRPYIITSIVSSKEVLDAMGINNTDVLWQMIANDPSLADTISKEAQQQISAFTEDNLYGSIRMAAIQEYQSMGIDIEQVQNSYIFKEGLIMLGIALIGSLCAIGAAYLAARTATGAARNMRKDVFEKVESFSSAEFSHFSTASLITRTTNDIQQVQNVLTMILRIVLFAPMMGLTSLFKVMRYPQLAGILGWSVAFIIVMMIIVFVVAMPKFRISQKLVDNLNLVTREQLEGMPVIRAFNNEKMEEERFDRANTDITKLNIFLNRLMAIVSPIMTLMMSGVTIAIIWIGASAIDLGSMQIGYMMAFIQYTTHVLISFMIVAMIFIMLPRSSVSANRIFEVLETKVSIKDPKQPVPLPEGNPIITFDHVSFAYPNAQQNVLEDITFTASAGETVAIIGSTGSGKSTLINLLPRFFDVTEGSIRFNGHP